MLRDILPKVDGEYRFNYSLKNANWFKVGGPAEVFYKPNNLEELSTFLEQLPNDIDINMLGVGSNILIRDGGVKGVVIKLGKEFNYIENHDDKLFVGGAVLDYNLAQYCLRQSISGFEFMVGIPGTVGAGIVTNAGAYGSDFAGLIDHVVAVDRTGKIHKFTPADFNFTYRKNNTQQQLIFVEVVFNFSLGDRAKIQNTMNEINYKRQQTQPITAKTAGSTFINPDNIQAWQLINECGLSGYRIGDAQVSPLHNNFLLNLDSAQAKDIEELGVYVQQQVLLKTKINLEWEVKRMGHYE